MARPKLPDAKRKKIDMRVSQTQKSALEKAAASVNMPTATWMLKTCLKEAERLDDSSHAL